jgi:uncharacterized protein (DUF952 family)
MTAVPSPKYVYKIVPEAPPEPLPEQYAISALDEKDGFIHLSSASQVTGTLDLFFGDATEVWVLKLDFARFEAKTKWENGFPHLYGNFGRTDIVSSQGFTRTSEQKWSNNPQLPEWLE